MATTTKNFYVSPSYSPSGSISYSSSAIHYHMPTTSIVGTMSCNFTMRVTYTIPSGYRDPTLLKLLRMSSNPSLQNIYTSTPQSQKGLWASLGGTITYTPSPYSTASARTYSIPLAQTSALTIPLGIPLAMPINVATYSYTLGITMQIRKFTTDSYAIAVPLYWTVPSLYVQGTYIVPINGTPIILI